MNNPIKITLVLLYNYFKEPGTNPRGIHGHPRMGSLFFLSLVLFFNISTLSMLAYHSLGGNYGLFILPGLMIILSLFFKEDSMKVPLDSKYAKKAWIGLISYSILSFILFILSAKRS